MTVILLKTRNNHSWMIQWSTNNSFLMKLCKNNNGSYNGVQE